MKSPWRTVQPLDPNKQYLVLVSDIPPLRLSSTWSWFGGAHEVMAQLGETDGVVGFSLSAKPLRKQYRTLSVWTDEEALASFARTKAHGRLVEELRPEQAPTTFLRWTFAGRDGRPKWRDATRRLQAETTTNQHRSNP